MRIVASHAVAIFGRLMFDLGFLKEILVAVEAKLAADFDQKLFVAGLMGLMAAQTLTILHRLMLDGGVGQKILVTLETKLAGGALEGLDLLKQRVTDVALITFLLCEGP